MAAHCVAGTMPCAYCPKITRAGIGSNHTLQCMVSSSLHTPKTVIAFILKVVVAGFTGKDQRCAERWIVGEFGET